MPYKKLVYANQIETFFTFFQFSELFQKLLNANPFLKKETVQRIAMDTVKNPHIIEITGEDGAWNRVWISEDSVKMESASCPDGLCVHQGAISDGLLPIVCLPNKVQIQIVEDNNEESSETEEFDAKVG